MHITNFEGKKQEVWNTIRTMNATWTKGDPDDLHKFFHPRMIAVTGPDPHYHLGAKACVEGWKEFAEQAHIHSWKEKDPVIELYDNSAVVAYYYELSCNFQGQDHILSGRDMFFLVHENNQWRIVGDHFSSFP